MSCEQNIKCEEACFEAFCELVENNYYLEGMIACIFLESWDYYRVCKEGRLVWDVILPEDVFEQLWEFDSEGMLRDMKTTIKRAYEEGFK